MKQNLHNLQKKLQKFQRKYLTANKVSFWAIITLVIIVTLSVTIGVPTYMETIIWWLVAFFWYLQGRVDAREADANSLRTLREYRAGIQVANESWDAVRGAYRALGVNATPAAQAIHNEYRYEMSKGPRNTIKAFNRTITKKREKLNERRASRTDS